jgi:hypothetical protein
MRMMETGVSDTAYTESGEVRLVRIVRRLEVKSERDRCWALVARTESLVPTMECVSGCAQCAPICIQRSAPHQVRHCARDTCVLELKRASGQAGKRAGHRLDSASPQCWLDVQASVVTRPAPLELDHARNRPPVDPPNQSVTILTTELPAILDGVSSLRAKISSKRGDAQAVLNPP